MGCYQFCGCLDCQITYQSVHLSVLYHNYFPTIKRWTDHIASQQLSQMKGIFKKSSVCVCHSPKFHMLHSAPLLHRAYPTRNKNSRCPAAHTRPLLPRIDATEPISSRATSSPTFLKSRLYAEKSYCFGPERSTMPHHTSSITPFTPDCLKVCSASSNAFSFFTTEKVWPFHSVTRTLSNGNMTYTGHPPDVDASCCSSIGLASHCSAHRSSSEGGTTTSSMLCCRSLSNSQNQSNNLKHRR